MKALPEIVSLKEKVEKDLLHRPGVTGVDVGYKYVDGKRTDQLAIRVLVSKKRKTVPKDEAIPAEIEGVPTDVIERRFELHASMRKKVEDVELMEDTTRYPTLKGGIGIGPCRAIGGYVYVGTLGAIVKDNATNQPMMLSNFHVMCVDTSWNVGDTMAQPSRVDGGSCPADQVGALQRSALTDKVDGAVASISGRPHACEIHEIGEVTGTAVAALDAPVRKRGRTTGLTYGIVDSISLSVNVDYGPGIGNKTLTNQIGILPDTARSEMFGDHGDSGSVVVDATGKVLGLYFAGDDTGYGVANQIADVLSALDVTLCVSSPKTILSDKHWIKEALIEKPWRKEFIKEFKLEKLEFKEHAKSEFELPKTFEGPIGQIPNLPTDVPQPGGVGGGAQSPQLKKREAKDAKDKSELKDLKPEFEAPIGRFDQPGGLQPGPTLPPKKWEIKEIKEFKEKPEIKEQFKEKIEYKEFKPELKDHKELKPEIKEFKLEKPERKESGKSEFELPKTFETPGQILQSAPPLSPSTGYEYGVGDPGNAKAYDYKQVEIFTPYKYYKEYKENKELKDVVDDYRYEIPPWQIPGPGPLSGSAGVGPLSPFISQQLRPDLTTGALKQESDLQNKDYGATSQRLQKEAADAMQAKVAFDNAQPQR